MVVRTLLAICLGVLGGCYMFVVVKALLNKNQDTERSAQCSPEPEKMQELHMATDYALWAINVTPQALGRGMSTLLVQERCDLWLNLTGM